MASYPYNNWFDSIVQRTPILGQFNGTKTIIGVLSLVLYVATQVDPELKPVVEEVLKYLGITMLPIGIAHKISKSEALRQ